MEKNCNNFIQMIMSKHPRINEILEKMKEINNRLIEHGYIPDTSWVNENISEEEKKTKLCYHSERFALAYARIITPPGKPIYLYKNLRVCGDCHETTKHIAIIYNRDIIVRDANRFHHFKPDGTCSCNNIY